MTASTPRQYCLTLDLKDDDDLIREYESYHAPGKVWPEVIDSIRESGILDMQIYRTGTQLIMVISVTESFNFDDKARRDRENSRVLEWERLMARFQRIDDAMSADAKWRGVKNIFDISTHGSKTN
jgi:L-rhamnose mutarotase